MNMDINQSIESSSLSALNRINASSGSSSVLGDLQDRFDKLQGGGDESGLGLKALQKDVNSALQGAEKTGLGADGSGAGDQDLMDMLMQLLQMVVQMMQKVQGGEDEEAGGTSSLSSDGAGLN